MKDLVFCAQNYDTMLEEAASKGMLAVDENGEKVIICNGLLPDGGNWFLNIIGEIPEAPGFWGRLRLNGNEPASLHFSDKIEQFYFDGTLGGWTKDGITLAPEWVGNVGQIA